MGDEEAAPLLVCNGGELASIHRVKVGGDQIDQVGLIDGDHLQQQCEVLSLEGADLVGPELGDNVLSVRGVGQPILDDGRQSYAIQDNASRQWRLVRGKRNDSAGGLLLIDTSQWSGHGQGLLRLGKDATINGGLELNGQLLVGIRQGCIVSVLCV